MSARKAPEQCSRHRADTFTGVNREVEGVSIASDASADAFNAAPPRGVGISAAGTLTHPLSRLGRTTNPRRPSLLRGHGTGPGHEAKAGRPGRCHATSPSFRRVLNRSRHAPADASGVQLVAAGSADLVLLEGHAVGVAPVFAAVDVRTGQHQSGSGRRLVGSGESGGTTDAHPCKFPKIISEFI